MMGRLSAKAVFSAILLLCLTLSPSFADEYEDKIAEEMAEKAQDPQLRKLMEQFAADDQNTQKFGSPPFHCPALAPSESEPTSVHALRPSDIKVVAAMGDSLTAGTGIKAKTILGEILPENRGLSWSGGGEGNYEKHLTVPNILKNYNPSVYGYATGSAPEWLKSVAKLNVAVGGAVSDELPAQARVLIDRMKADSKVDFENDWKLVTILSGNNDLCDYCNKPSYTSASYKQNLIDTLDILHAEMPKAFVSLVEPLNMEVVLHLNQGLICSTLHYLFCDCAAFPGSPEQEAAMIQESDDYQAAVQEVANSGRYDTREDFTVVAQPFWNQTYVPRDADGQPDLSFFAPDCFHLSRKGQEVAAAALWNNMIEPVSVKRKAWTPGEKIECPTDQAPLIYTNKNSNSARGPQVRVNPKPHHQQFGFGAKMGADHRQPLMHGQPEKDNSRGGSSSTATALGVVSGLAVVALIVGAVVFAVRRIRQRQVPYDAI